MSMLSEKSELQIYRVRRPSCVRVESLPVIVWQCLIQRLSTHLRDTVTVTVILRATHLQRLVYLDSELCLPLLAIPFL